MRGAFPFCPVGAAETGPVEDEADDDEGADVGGMGRGLGSAEVAAEAAAAAEEEAAAEEAAAVSVAGAGADTAGIPVVASELEGAMAVGDWASGTSASATSRWGAFQTSEEKRCNTVRTTRLQGSRASVDRRVWMVAGLSRIVGRSRMRRSRWSSNEEAYARALLAAAVPVSQ